MKDELDDCITTLVALDESLSRLRSKLESFRSAQTSSSLTGSMPESGTPAAGASGSSISDTPGSAGATESEPVAKKRKLEPAQNYADLRRSTDVKKAKRLISARENSIKAVQKLLDKEMAEKGSGAEEAEAGEH